MAPRIKEIKTIWAWSAQDFDRQMNEALTAGFEPIGLPQVVVTRMWTTTLVNNENKIVYSDSTQIHMSCVKYG